MHPITKYYREMRDRLVEKEMDKDLRIKNCNCCATGSLPYPYCNYCQGSGFVSDNEINYVQVEEQVNDVKITITTNTPAHYDNSKGSLYKFAEDHKLNAWEFDILKRVVRCRNKGQFLEDIDKTIEVLKLYKKEYDFS